MMSNLTMSERMESRDGMKHGTGKLCRFKAGGFPIKNVRSGPLREPLWRVEGKSHWLRLKQRCHGSETVLHFADGSSLIVDISRYAWTASDH
jgi:hypothetical protein